jgi:two-component system, OmpR family, response regulator
MERQLHLMYVDDESDIRDVVEFALEDETDFRLSLCASGNDALEALRSSVPDLILLDVMMPGIDGPSLLARIREAGHAVPVAFMTAKVQSQDLAYLRSRGAVGVIAKPFDPQLLAQQIREIWRAAQNPSTE